MTYAQRVGEMYWQLLLAAAAIAGIIALIAAPFFLADRLAPRDAGAQSLIVAAVYFGYILLLPLAAALR